MKKKILFLLLMMALAFGMCACGGEEKQNLDISGEYQDEVSQRATMMLTKNEDTNAYDAVISWTTSATELVEWSFSGDFDGEKIEYNEGICKVYTTKEDGNSNEEIKEGDYNGTLTMQDDKIQWEGSNEGETAMFVLIPETEQE